MSYTGTKLGQDIRFKDPDKNILLSMKTPKIFNTTVSKKNIIILPIIKLWLTQKIIELLEFEDETLVNLIINLINSSQEKIDPKNMQYQISGFLGDKTYSFMKKFWKLLINVQECYLQDKRIPEELYILKEEDDKKKAMNKKFEKYKEYEDNNDKKEKYNNKYDNKYEYEDKTKIELMKVIDSFKKDEKNKIRNKSRSRSRSKSYEKRKHRSRSRDHERKKEKEEIKEFKYKSRSRSRKRNKRRSKSSSRSKSSYKERRNRKEREEYDYYYRKNKSRKKKYSKNYSSSSSSISPDYDYHSSRRDKDKKEYDVRKQRRDRSISSSSDSSETFKI